MTTGRSRRTPYKQPARKHIVYRDGVLMIRFFGSHDYDKVGAETV
jgi:hypothetical protein